MTDHNSIAWNGCYARLENDELVIGNTHIERRWSVQGGQLHALSFLDKSSAHDWFVTVAPGASLLSHAAPSNVAAPPRFSTSTASHGPLEEVSLRVELCYEDCGVARFQIFPNAQGVTLQLVATASASSQSTSDGVSASSGVEIDESATEETPAAKLDVMECFVLRPQHLKLCGVELRDQTDDHNNLVFEREYLLHPNEAVIQLPGNVFWWQDVLSGDGLIWLKQAPLPHARPVKVLYDLEMRGGTCWLHGHGVDEGGGEGDPAVLLSYSGGRAGRIAALHNYQRQFRPYQAQRDGLFLSNTWGDRSRDARINEAFLMQEIEAGARLGVEVLQIDDGWQQGRTANSAEAVEAPNPSRYAWNNFWEANSRVWEPDTTRFPQGLEPLLERARQHNMQFGLWFAPDSANDVANWQRDAEQILHLHRALGINYFKLDAIKVHSKTGEGNLRRFFEQVLRESNGAVVFDTDVTAEVRPGYFGFLDTGPIFVENRYTDWVRYYPHATLRNFWMLAQYVDPLRLRMEFLNNRRNVEKYFAAYDNDPLAPVQYSPAYLFATVMWSSPLGWFETSNLPPEYFQQIAPLVALRRHYREEIFGGTIIPIGDAPDGTRWTGFVSTGSEVAHALIFREHNVQAYHSFDLAFEQRGTAEVRWLAGAGEGVLENGQLHITVPQPHNFVWLRLTTS
jgi:alpha-galactosidase